MKQENNLTRAQIVRERIFSNRKRRRNDFFGAVIVAFAMFMLVLPVSAQAAKIGDLTSLLSAREITFLEQFEEVKIEIMPGDTAWDIQLKLTPSEDVREMLYYAEKENGIKSMGNIQTGKTYVFFKEIKETN